MPLGDMFAFYQPHLALCTLCNYNYKSIIMSKKHELLSNFRSPVQNKLNKKVRMFVRYSNLSLCDVTKWPVTKWHFLNKKRHVKESCQVKKSKKPRKTRSARQHPPPCPVLYFYFKHVQKSTKFSPKKESQLWLNPLTHLRVFLGLFFIFLT